jgi:hypothetical protein
VSDTRSGLLQAVAPLADEPLPVLDRVPAGSPGDEEIAVSAGKTR